MRRAKEHAQIFWEAFVRFFKDHGPEHAGNMAFLGMLALFPFLIFLLALSGLFGQTEAGRAAIDFLMANLPADIASTVRQPIQNIIETSDRGILAGSIGFALWTSINGLEAARLTVIQAYDSWEHAAPFWQRMLMNLAIVVIAAVLVMVAMSVIVLTPVLIDLIERLVALPERFHEYSFWARYFAAPILLFFSLLVLYRVLAPKLPTHKRFHLPGAVFTVAMWLVIGKAMALFLRHAERYDVFYGSLAGVVLMQLFFFFSAAAFILGAHLNASYSRHRGLRDWRRKTQKEPKAPDKSPEPPEDAQDTRAAARAAEERRSAAG